jgi:hypothetical protein
VVCRKVRWRLAAGGWRLAVGMATTARESESLHTVATGSGQRAAGGGRRATDSGRPTAGSDGTVAEPVRCHTAGLGAK